MLNRLALRVRNVFNKIFSCGACIYFNKIPRKAGYSFYGLKTIFNS